MSSDQHRRLDQPKVVDVHYHDRWLHGRLTAWRRENGRWLGYVEFSHPDGVTQPKWFDQDDIRPRS